MLQTYIHQILAFLSTQLNTVEAFIVTLTESRGDDILDHDLISAAAELIKLINTVLTK